MNRAQRMDAWFGRIWIEPEVVALMAEEYDEEKLAAVGMTKSEAVEEAGSPALRVWLERHYDGRAAREARREGVTDRPVISEYSILRAEAPHDIARVRLVTQPTKSTGVRLIRPDEPRSMM